MTHWLKGECAMFKSGRDLVRTTSQSLQARVCIGCCRGIFFENSGYTLWYRSFSRHEDGYRLCGFTYLFRRRGWKASRWLGYRETVLSGSRISAGVVYLQVVSVRWSIDDLNNYHWKSPKICSVWPPIFLEAEALLPICFLSTSISFVYLLCFLITFGLLHIT